MRNFIISLFLILPLIILGCSSDNSQQQNQAQPGVPDASANAEIIENATFTDLDGNEVTLADYRGKVLLIDFWESWCGPCLQVFPAMQDLREEYPDNFEVLAVTLGMSEGPEDARNFKEEHQYDFQFLYDRNNVSDDLGIYGIPFKIYIDPEGKMIKQERGSAGRQGDYDRAKAVLADYINN